MLTDRSLTANPWPLVPLLMPDATAIVVHYNTPRLLARALNALRRLRGYGRLEVIVVDNASRQFDVRGWKQRYPEVRFIVTRRNLGFGAANNVARSRARGDVLLLVNSDAFPEPAALEKSLEFLGRRPRCAVMGAALETVEGAPLVSAQPFLPAGWKFREFAWRRLPGLMRALGARPAEATTPRGSAPPLARPVRVDWVPGAFMAVRRQALGDEPLFRPDFFMYFEDTDLCRRLHERGWEVWLNPDVHCVHLEGASTGASIFMDCALLSNHYAPAEVTRKLAVWNAAQLRYFFLEGGVAAAARNLASELAARLVSLFAYALGLRHPTAGLVRVRFLKIEAALRGARQSRLGARTTGVVEHHADWRAALERYVAFDTGAERRGAGRSDARRRQEEPLSPRPRVPPSPRRSPLVSVVVIGRNEGARLRACLESVRRADFPQERLELIYVDSASGDGSADLAARYADHVIRLTEGRMSAARARQAGWQAASGEVVQFLDGDTRLEPAWLGRGLAALGVESRETRVESQEQVGCVGRTRLGVLHPPYCAGTPKPQLSVAAVFGRLEEVNPKASFYTRVANLEWPGSPVDTAARGVRRSAARAAHPHRNPAPSRGRETGNGRKQGGEHHRRASGLHSQLSTLDSQPMFGGCVMIRRAVLEATGGFDAALVAGEEPDLAYRIRQRGYAIVCLEDRMARHELGITRFADYWRRSVRSGWAYAELARRHGRGRERFCVRKVLANFAEVAVWLALLAATVAAGIGAVSGRIPAYYAAVGPVTWIAMVAARIGLIALKVRRRAPSAVARRDALLYGVHCQLVRLPMCIGQLKALVRRTGKRRGMTSRRRVPCDVSETSSVLGMRLTRMSFDEAVCACIEAGRRRGARAGVPPCCAYAVTPNVDHVVQLRRNGDLRAAYRAARFVFADGQPIVWAARLLRDPVPEKVSGADLVPALCAAAAREGLKVFFLGGASEVSHEAAHRMRERHPGLVVEAYSPPLGFERDARENARTIEIVRHARPDILVVALGAPRQEIWLHRHLAETGAAFGIGVGASLDFIVGAQRRAPRWMQRAGLEWFWRLVTNPRRLWRRYFVDAVVFPLLVARAWLGRRAKGAGRRLAPRMARQSRAPARALQRLARLASNNVAGRPPARDKHDPPPAPRAADAPRPAGEAADSRSRPAERVSVCRVREPVAVREL